MRYLMIMLLILWAFSFSLGAEDTLSLDRCLVLNSQSDFGAESRLAIHFTIPEDLDSTEVIYAELYFSLPPLRLGADSLFEIRFNPLLQEWSEEELTYENSQAITDSMSTALFTVKLSDANLFHFDLTSYLREAVLGERENFGLIGTAELLGERSIRLPDVLGQELRQEARIRVIFK